MDAMTNLASSASGSRSRIVAYWVTTALVVFELALGGVWDILRVPQVRDLIERLGYPQYFLVILGTPGFPPIMTTALCLVSVEK